MGVVAELTDSTFDSEVLQSEQPVLVDFWAPDCPPCRTITPLIQELAAENTGFAKVYKINVNDHQAAAQKYNVGSIPTLIIFKDGEVIERMIGLQPKSRLQQALDKAKG